MENASELLINVVRTNKPKTLEGLSQKASGRYRKFPFSYRRLTTTGGQTVPNPFVGTYAERGKPVVLPIRESES